MLPTVEPEERMVHAIGTLRAYAFVTKRADTDSYDMHRLVHLATKVWLDKQDALQKAKEEATIHLAESFPSDDYTNRATWREYFPHAFQCLRITKELDIKARFDLCMAVGRCLLVDGRVGEAVVWLSECCLWWQGHFPEDHLDRLTSQHELAVAYKADGQVSKAVRLLEQVVVIQEKVLKEDHPSRLLTSQHELAVAYKADGQVSKAVRLLEQVVVIQEKVLEGDHPSRLLTSQHELAKAYQADGQVSKAVRLLEQVVIKDKVLKEDHPSRLASQHALAVAYKADGQVSKAIRLLEQVVLKEKVLKEDHPSRLASQHELATAYQADGQTSKAVELLEQVVAIQEQVLKEDHPDRLLSQHVLLRLYALQRTKATNH